MTKLEALSSCISRKLLFEPGPGLVGTFQGERDWNEKDGRKRRKRRRRFSSPGYRGDVSGFKSEDGYLLANGLLVDQNRFGEEPC